MDVRSLRRSATESLDVGRRTASLLVIGLLVDAAFLFIYLVALQSYLPESLHASKAIVGYALATFGLAKLVTQLGSGFVSDRLGTRRAMLIGIALLFAADAATWLLAHVAPWLIVVTGAVEGLGSSVTWPAVYTAGAARVDPGERGRFTALLTLSTAVALGVGLGGGGALNYFVSFDVAMIAPVAAVAASFGLALLAPSRIAVAASETPARPTPGQFRAIVSSRERASFAALILAEASAVGALTAVFRAYGRDVLDVSLVRQAALLAPGALLGGALVIPGGTIADRIGARRVMVAGFATTGIGLLLLSRWGDPSFVLPVATVTGGGFGLAMPSIAATMLHLAGPEGSRGGVIGWFMTMDGLGYAVGPAAAGVLLAASGASSVLVFVGVLFVVVACIALTSRMGDSARTAAVGVPAGVSNTLIGGES